MANALIIVAVVMCLCGSMFLALGMPSGSGSSSSSYTEVNGVVTSDESTSKPHKPRISMIVAGVFFLICSIYIGVKAVSKKVTTGIRTRARRAAAPVNMRNSTPNRRP